VRPAGPRGRQAHQGGTSDVVFVAVDLAGMDGQPQFMRAVRSAGRVVAASRHAVGSSACSLTLTDMEKNAPP